MAIWDVMVNGASLNTLATGVAALPGFGRMSGRSYHNVINTGTDGSSFGVGGFQEGSFGMRIWVDGCDRTTGAVPVGSTPEVEAWANYSWLLSILTSDLLLEVRVTMPNGTVRRCRAQLGAMTEPAWVNPGSLTFNLEFTIPSVFWEDPVATTLTFTGTAVQRLTNQVGNAFVTDAVFTIRNGGVNCQLGSVAGTLSYVRYIGTLGVDDTWTVDCGSRTSEVNGRPVMGRTTWPTAGEMLRIPPPYTVRLAGVAVPDAAICTITTRSKFH